MEYRFDPQAITQLREQKGWTPEEMAKRIGVSRTVVRDWERGDSIPGGRMLLKLMNAFGATPGFFFRELNGKK